MKSERSCNSEPVSSPGSARLRKIENRSHSCKSTVSERVSASLCHFSLGLFRLSPRHWLAALSRVSKKSRVSLRTTPACNMSTSSGRRSARSTTVRQLPFARPPSQAPTAKRELWQNNASFDTFIPPLQLGPRAPQTSHLWSDGCRTLLSGKNAFTQSLHLLKRKAPSVRPELRPLPSHLRRPSGKRRAIASRRRTDTSQLLHHSSRLY